MGNPHKDSGASGPAKSTSAKGPSFGAYNKGSPNHRRFVSPTTKTQGRNVGLHMHTGPTPESPGTTNFQGAANTTTYVTLHPNSVHSGARAASRNMAASQSPSRNGHVTRFKPPYKNTQQRPVSLTTTVYGPSARKSNSAAPEASVFANGGGNVRYLRQIGRPQRTKGA